MALKAFAASIGAAKVNAERYSVRAVGAGPVVASTTVDGDVTTVDGNVATLVADGASPTQAHVTTLNTNWGTLKTDWATLKASIGLTTNNVSVVYDSSAVTNMNQLRSAIENILRQIEGAGLA